jgi:hypothetical protein
MNLAAALLLGLAQTPEAAAPVNAPEPAVVAYQRALDLADLALAVARQRICGQAGRGRYVARLSARLTELTIRARPVFGELGQPLSLVEPERPGPRCDRFRRSTRAAVRRLDEAEAILAAAAREG